MERWVNVKQMEEDALKEALSRTGTGMFGSAL